MYFNSTETTTMDNEIHICDLFTSRTLADVIFVFDSRKEIAAHKLILAMKSPVFCQMFFGPLKETGDIKIVDTLPKAFTEFLQFFYLNKVKLTSDNIQEVMELADKYDVPQCMAACSKFLKNIAMPENMCLVYQMALLYSNTDLIEYCEEKIQIDPKSIFDTSSFKNCDRVILKCILAINLHCDELTVFNACMDWAKNTCERDNIVGNAGNYKKVLGDCFQLIRFPSMTNQEFCSVLKNHKSFFDIDEMTDIFMHITLKQPLQVATEFSEDCRQNELICTRVPNQISVFNHTRDHTIHQAEVMKFSTNQRIVLKGVVINDRIHTLIRTELLGNMKIFNRELSKDDLLLDQPIVLSSGNSNCYNFLKPIIVEPQQKHEIQILFQTFLGVVVFPVQVIQYGETVNVSKIIEFKFEKSPNASYDCSQSGLMSGLCFVPM